MIHLATPFPDGVWGRPLWCDESSPTAIRTDVVGLCTCLGCLERLADHHRVSAVKAAARICEVIS